MIPALIASFLITLAPTEITVSAEDISWDLEAWKKLPQVKVSVVEQGKTTVYAGIPLAHLIKTQLPGKNQMVELRALSDTVLVVGATDGYQAVLAATAVAMDPKGERFLLAFERDGKPLGENQGPARLIVPGDPQRVRWVRMVNSLQLIRLNSRKSR